MKGDSTSLQDSALLLALARLGQKSSAGGCFEDLTDTLVGTSRALEVLVGADLLADFLTLFGRDGLLGGLGEFFNGLGVVAKIHLAANKDDGKALAEVKNLGNPLLLDVVERVWRVDGETDQNDVGVGVRQRTETVIIFLASSIPKGEFNMLAINLDVGDIVLEDGRDVDLREGTLGEDDQQTSLTTGTITNDDKLATDLGHLVDRRISELANDGYQEVARSGRRVSSITKMGEYQKAKKRRATDRETENINTEKGCV